MNSQASMSRAQLEQAEALLRDVLLKDFEGSKEGDAGSLERMMTHIVNMQGAVSISTDVHANAAKRLGDFAVAAQRMVDRRPQSAARLTRLAEVLRAASAGLNESVCATTLAESDETLDTPRVG